MDINNVRLQIVHYLTTTKYEGCRVT
jgi:hypothetical protein